MTLTVSREALLVDGEDVVFRQAIHDALGFSVRLQEIRNRLGESIGLSGTAYSVLIAIEHLGAKEDEIGVSRLAEHLHLSAAFVTIEVGKLVKAGLVSKVPHASDGRRVLLGITNEARMRLEGLGTLQRPVNDAIFAGLDATQFGAFATIMASLVDGTGEALALLHLDDQQRRRSA